jgi:hypothetical protein
MALEDIPSARLGKKLADTITDAGFRNFEDFERFRMDRGLPAIGSAEGKVTREALNKMVPESKKYVAFADNPEFTKVEIEQTKKEFKTPDDKQPTTKQRKIVGDRIIKKVTNISDDADVFFGDKMTNAKKKFIQEAVKKANLLIDDITKFGFRSLVPILAAGGIPGIVISAIAETATAAPAGEGSDLEESIEDKIMKNVGDFSKPSASSMLLEQLSQDATMKAGGGMMSINNMIRPVGYKDGTKDGTLVGDKEKLFGGKNRARIENFVNEMIEGEGVTKDLGRGILSAISIPGIAIKDLIGILNPVKEAKGMGLLEDASDLSTLTKRLLIKKSLVDYGGRDALQKMDDLDRMSPVEIEIEFQKLMGAEE